MASRFLLDRFRRVIEPLEFELIHAQESFVDSARFLCRKRSVVLQVITDFPNFALAFKHDTAEFSCFLVDGSAINASFRQEASPGIREHAFPEGAEACPAELLDTLTLAAVDDAFSRANVGQGRRRNPVLFRYEGLEGLVVILQDVIVVIPFDTPRVVLVGVTVILKVFTSPTTQPPGRASSMTSNDAVLGVGSWERETPFDF